MPPDEPVLPSAAGDRAARNCIEARLRRMAERTDAAAASYAAATARAQRLMARTEEILNRERARAAERATLGAPDALRAMVAGDGFEPSAFRL